MSRIPQTREERVVDALMGVLAPVILVLIYGPLVVMFLVILAVVGRVL